MKTVLIAHNYSRNSFATMSYSLSHYLANEGYKVIFVSYRPYFIDKLVIKKGKGEIIIYSWPTKKRPVSIKDLLWYSKIYLEHRPEIIIGHFTGGNISLIVSKVLSFGRSKTIVYYHTLLKQLVIDNKGDSFTMRLLRLRKAMFYKFFCNKIVCPSLIAKKDLLHYFKTDKGFVVLNPMDDRYNDDGNISTNTIVISYLGRLDSSKGVIDLIMAFKAYKKKVANTKIVLNIAGSGSEEDVIVKMIIDDSDINFFGELEYKKIDNYLKNSHFIVIPSKFDAFNVVGVESIMNRTPLLISNNVGLADYLVDGKDCFKFNPDINSLISILERVENNFHLQKEIANNARITFENKFTISNYCCEMIKLIEN